jgi:hypothetical protein
MNSNIDFYGLLGEGTILKGGEKKCSIQEVGGHLKYK